VKFELNLNLSRVVAVINSKLKKVELTTADKNNIEDFFQEG